MLERERPLALAPVSVGADVGKAGTLGGDRGDLSLEPDRSSIKAPRVSAANGGGGKWFHRGSPELQSLQS
jgi:hypothetical protein